MANDYFIDLKACMILIVAADASADVPTVASAVAAAVVGVTTCSSFVTVTTRIILFAVVLLFFPLYFCRLKRMTKLNLF